MRPKSVVVHYWDFPNVRAAMKNGSSESLMGQWFRRVWNEADVSAIDELALPSMTSHGLIASIQGREAWIREFYEPIRAVFSGITVELIEEAVAGDKIFGRLVATQTPKVTGSPAAMHGMCVMRIQDGKIAEAWDAWDFLELLEAMGKLPPQFFIRAVSGEVDTSPLLETR